MMREKKLTTEHLIYLIILGVALLLRVYRLGITPLPDSEARLAWDAFQIAGHAASQPGGHPAYSLITAFIFFLVGASNAAARFVPAVSGSLLIALPYLLRNRMGQKAALLFAIGLAVDPILINDARMAGGVTLAAMALYLALSAWDRGYFILAGALAGLAILSGPQFFHGLILVILTWLTCQVLRIRLGWQHQNELEEELSTGMTTKPWRRAAIGLGAVLILGGTWFFTVPGGLGAMAQALPDYFRGWVNQPDVPAWLVFVAIVVYGILPGGLGIISILRREAPDEPPLRLPLGILVMIGILLAFAYPAQKVANLTWVMVPLWALAALELERYFSRPEENIWPVIGHASVIFFLLANMGTVLTGLTQYTIGEDTFTLRLVVAAGALVLIGLISSMVGLIWTSQTALRGLAWGVVSALGVYTLATGFAVSPGATPVPPELWDPVPKAGQVVLLQETIQDLGEYVTGRPDEIKIVSQVDTPSMRWALRDIRPVAFDASDAGSMDLSPEVVITWQETDSPKLAAAYRGQDFSWEVQPYWSQMPLEIWLDWLVSRDIQEVSRQVIVWARVDIFPDVTGAPGEEDAP